MDTVNDLNQTLLELCEQRKPLSSCFTLKELQGILVSADYEIRLLLAESLAFEKDEAIAVDFLEQLAADPSDLVRAEAVDTLSVFFTEKSYAICRAALQDSSVFPRAYAAYSVAVLGRCLHPAQTREILRNAVGTETHELVLAGVWEGLYILGDETALEELFRLFRSTSDYHIQCAVLNALSEILCLENKNQISSFLDSIQAQIFPASVKSTLCQLKELLKAGQEDSTFPLS